MPGRYATALFELAQQAGSVDLIGKNLDDFAALLDTSGDLKRLVSSPVFSAEDQAKALEAIITRAKFAPLAVNFFRLITRNRRLSAVKEMISAYRTLAADARGDVVVEVVSADKLNAAQVKNLKTALKDVQGRDVQLVERVDASLLGGLIVKVGSRMVDNSLRTKIQNLRQAMKGAS